MTSTDPLIGQTLGDYLIQGLLGQGGMARVYKGYDAKLDRYAAVKVIEPHLIVTDSDEKEEYRERFLREARAIARLNHPNIVSIFQFGQNNAQSLYYMAMSLLEGRDLRHILKDYNKQAKFLTYGQMLNICRDIADALDYAHRQGVIHRDVKPSNIMVSEGGHAYLMDFGLVLDAQEGTIGNTFGSVHYIAPEQAVSSAQATAQSDLYSLGVVAFEMLTGRVPFEDSSAMSVALKHISDPPPPPSSFNPRVTPQVEEVILKALDKDPRRRYPNGFTFVRALEQAFAADEDTEELEDGPPFLPVPGTGVPPIIETLPLGTPNPPNAVARLQDEIPTISDSSRNKLLPFEDELKQQTEARRTRRQQQRVFMGLALVLLILLGTAAVLLLNLRNEGNNTGGELPTSVAAASTTLAVVAEITEDVTVTPPPTTAAPATPTSTNTPVPTESDATRTLTFTRTPTDVPSPTPTDAPTETPTPDVTNTPAINAVAEDEAQLLLRYDGRSLVVYNRALEESVNLSGVTFVQVQPDDTNLTFRTARWPDPTGSLNALRPKDCFQVFTIEFFNLPATEFPAEICSFRQGFISTVQSFWVAAETSSFEVRRNGVVLGTCPTVEEDFRGEVRCVVRIEPDAD
ncbi:MAG: hypothetical protein OHK0046_48900 [Anaerolineae bacterium]